MSCPCCGGNQFESLISFANVPQSGVFEVLPSATRRTFKLCFEICTACAVVRQNPAAEIRDYVHVDRSAAKRLPDYADKLIRMIEESGARRSDAIVEVGCGDGAFLVALREAGFERLVGVEPSATLAARTRDAGFAVFDTYFDEDSSARVAARFGSAAVIVARHTLEHVPKPDAFVRAVHSCLSAGGCVLIEVPDAEVIPEQTNLHELWDEHLHYFAASNTDALLRRNGFDALETTTFSHLGSRNLVVRGRRADRSSYSASSISGVARSLSRWRAAPAQWRSVGDALRRRFQAATPPHYAIGASHPQTNFLGFANLGPLVDFFIDDDPSKAGKYPPVKEGKAAVMTTAEFVATAHEGTLLLTGFGYPAWTERLTTHAIETGMKLIDPLEIKRQCRASAA